MSLKYGILGFLSGGAMTGYDIVKAFKESTDFFWRVQTSQVYRELTAMEQQGLVTFNRILQQDKPNKKEYSITQSGMRSLTAWLAADTFDESVNHKNAFLLQLFFSAGRDKDNLIGSLRRFQESCKKYGESMGSIEQSVDVFSDCFGVGMQALCGGIASSFGRYYFDMCVNWSGDAIRFLEILPDVPLYSGDVENKSLQHDKEVAAIGAQKLAVQEIKTSLSGHNSVTTPGDTLDAAALDDAMNDAAARKAATSAAEPAFGVSDSQAAPREPSNGGLNLESIIDQQDDDISAQINDINIAVKKYLKSFMTTLTDKE